MTTLLIVLRVLHIGFGVFWAGTAIALNLYVQPTARALGPKGGAFMQHMMAPTRLPMAMAISAITTTVSGLALFWMIAGTAFTSFIRTPFGLTLVLGGLVGIVAFIVGGAFMQPTIKRIRRLGAEMLAPDTVPTQEQVDTMNCLQERTRKLGLLASGLLAISVILMAIARYLH